MKIDTTKLRALVKACGVPNTRLAVQAGITRQALQGMLKADQCVEVRERTVTGLARALRLPDASFLSADPLLGYKQAVADEHTGLTFRGLGLPTTYPKSIDDLYVSIRLAHIPDRGHEHDCQRPTGAAEVERIEESDGETVIDCLSQHRRILIRGDPGSGKTTALRYAARAYAEGRIAEGRFPKLSRVPMFVALADFAKARERDSEMTLIRFVVTRTLRDASPEYWAEVEHHITLALDRGTCLVLFDGLDEAGDDTQILEVLRGFIADFSRNQFVVTSRVVGLDEGPWLELGFVSYQVARWHEHDIREFARRWYVAGPAVGKKQQKYNEQRAEELTKVILNNEPLCAIASNPLMLTILAALHHAHAALPQRRVDLYAKIVEVMLETWEASKREAKPGDPLYGIFLEGREFGWLLGRLALGMQREGRILRPRWWLNESVQQFLLDQMGLEGNLVKEQSERVIRYLCERTGLLIERSDGMFGFWHRTFQEYFAARGLLLEVEGGGDIVALLRPYLFHPPWEEVVIHVMASLSVPRATTLLRVMLDDPDPAGRFLRRGQRLALRCLVDGAAIVDRTLLGQVFSDGEAIGRSQWLGIALDAISLLERLHVTRHKAEARQMFKEIEEAAKRELPESDYVTLYMLTHDLPDGPKHGAPGTVCRKSLGGRKVELVWTDWKKRLKEPDKWRDEALTVIRDSKADLKSRMVLISVLGEEADENDEAQQALQELLVRDRLPEIRAECAKALENAASTHAAIAKLLLNRLDKDKADMVRGQCAVALRGVAPNQTEVRVLLEELFASGSELVRGGAAKGLSGLDFTASAQEKLLRQFLTTIASPSEPAVVRCASMWAIAALQKQKDKADVRGAIEKCLDDNNPHVRRFALHVLADAIAEKPKEWPQPLIERIETMLMAVPDPCSCLFSDLMIIVAMKEIHGGRRLERILGGALASLGDLIRMAFVFGSVARLEQVQDSDIDLMIVGDVRLKEVGAALHAQEQILGRTINPVLFSAEKFREQYREGNPFLLDVVRKEKIFLKGNRDELTELVADRSTDKSSAYRR